MKNLSIYLNEVLFIGTVMMLIRLELTIAQYYPSYMNSNGNNPSSSSLYDESNSNDYTMLKFPQQQSSDTINQQSDDIERKYVNSGQSVLLVCDLPNNMPDGKVLFIKYDSKVLSAGSDIREDSDDERFEIGQQYAWEWSLKINSINEDDSGIYFCKVGNTIIKQYEIIVRVPPRIKDDGSGSLVTQKSVKEGSSVQFSCLANGTPKPNITWFIISTEDQQNLIQMPQTGSYLNLINVTRYSPRRYQCKASNNIPPSDTRNFTLSIEFAPEIDIQSKLNTDSNIMVINCTINAFPLTNRYFWRKDASFIRDGIKYEIKNIRLSDYTIISQLLIKYYNELDQGLYECSAENDLRVSKIVYTLKDTQDLRKQNLIPIGFANNYRDQQQSSNGNNNLVNKLDNNLDTSTKPTQSHQKNRKYNLNKPKSQYSSLTNQQQQTKLNNKKYKNSFDPDDVNYQKDPTEQQQTSKNQRKHQRNHKNLTRLNNEKLNQALSTSTLPGSGSTPPSNFNSNTNNNSPYIILIDDENSLKTNEDSDDDLTKSKHNDYDTDRSASSRSTLDQSPILNKSSTIAKFNLFKNLFNLTLIFLIVTCLCKITYI